MAGNEIFSTVIRGYKKDEVAAYIEDLSDQLQQLKIDLDRKEVELDRITKELRSVQETTTRPDENLLADERAKIRDELEQEFRAEFEAKLAEQTALIEEKAGNKSEDSEAQRKAKEYDECKDALAELMIQARRNADDIVNKAKAEAQMLRAKSQAEFSQLGTNFSVLQQNVGNIRVEFRQNIDKISEQFDLFEEQLFALQNDVEQTVISVSGDVE